MAAGYLVFLIGLAGIGVAYATGRNARRNGYYERTTGRWVSPTDAPAIKKYLMGQRAIAVIGLVISAIGMWLILSPQTFLTLLPQ